MEKQETMNRTDAIEYIKEMLHAQLDTPIFFDDYFVTVRDKDTDEVLDAATVNMIGYYYDFLMVANEGDRPSEYIKVDDIPTEELIDIIGLCEETMN